MSLKFYFRVMQRTKRHTPLTRRLPLKAATGRLHSMRKSVPLRQTYSLICPPLTGQPCSCARLKIRTLGQVCVSVSIGRYSSYRVKLGSGSVLLCSRSFHHPMVAVPSSGEWSKAGHRVKRDSSWKNSSFDFNLYLF